MPWLRYLPFLIGALLIVVLIVWLISSLAVLYSNIALFSPLLANVLLVVLLSLMLALLGGLVYYAMLFRRPRKRRQRRISRPKDKAEANERTLRLIRRQAQEIQDEVARQALLEEAQRLEANLLRREVRVVIFGTGSAGKTSVANAILGEIVGDVGAPMGTTTTEATYRLGLQGLNREIWLTDTPGILEAGVVGTEREQHARQLATEADLLLFVVDNDLRQSEYEPLRRLVDIGKRSLVVFNKIDLYPEPEQAQITAQIRARLRHFVPAEDVVAVAAHPAAASLATGERVQPDPIIEPLLERMAAVLRSEGEDLVADNILLQSKQLGDRAQQIIAVQRERQANRVIERYQWIGAGVVTVTPLPVVDLLATAAVNTQMVVELGRIYGCEMDADRGRELALSLAKTLGSLGIVKGALQLISTALQTNVATFVIGRAIQGITAAYLTRIAGKSFMEYFKRDQDWGDGGMAEVVQQQFQLNRREEFIRAFVQDAIARVINPLTQRLEELPPFPQPRIEDEPYEHQPINEDR